MSNIRIPPPPADTSDIPDKYTRMAPDFTGPHAENRILLIELKWFKYGTDDKSHASALVLSGLILCVSIIISVIGLGAGSAKWLELLITWLGNAFLFTAGIAVGSRGKSDKKPSD